MALLKYKCPYCGRKLRMLSTGNVLVVGCDNCGIYIIVDGDETMSESDINNVDRITEEALARRLYKKYIMYSIKAMIMRESTKSINNSQGGE